MDFYCVDKVASLRGKHNVHTLSCKGLPKPTNIRYLGYLGNSNDAVNIAKRFYREICCCSCCQENLQKEQLKETLHKEHLKEILH